MTGVKGLCWKRTALIATTLLATGCGQVSSTSVGPVVVTPTPTTTPGPTPTPSPPPVTAPSPPSAVIAVAQDGAATLSWEASPAATSYTVSRGTGAGGPFATIASGLTGTTYADSGLTNGMVYFYVVSATNAAGGSGNATRARVTPVSAPASGAVRWPLSSSTLPDADGIRFPYAPRRIGSYDFHAGIDIPAPRGTPVYAIMDGVVTGITLDDGTSGPGNRVLVNHGDQKWVGYLHLDRFASGISVGTPVSAGTLLGYVGKTGANTDHLHLTYMVGLPSESTSESRSKNPLEILPHTAPSGITAMFVENNSVEVTLAAHQMTVRWIILKGEGQTRLLDYYDVVARGSSNRNEQVQFGMHLNASAPPAPDPAAQLNFTLTVRPDPVTAFTVERVILKDVNGATLLDRAK